MKHTLFLLTWLSVGVAWAEPAPREAALIDLANGKPGRAVSRLQSAVRSAPEADRPALRCLLGRAQRLAGKTAAAAETLAQVPASAECARRAAYERADALLDLGKADAAAAEYARLGAIELGAERDADTADWILGLAERALKDESHGMASELYDLVLSAQVGPTRRRALAERIATAAVEADDQLSVDRLPAVLMERLVAQDTPANRRLLAPYTTAEEAQALLMGPKPDAASLKTLAAVLDDHVDLRLAALDALAATGGDAGKAARAEAIELRLSRTRLGAVEAAAKAMAGSTGDAAMTISSIRAGLLARAGDRAIGRAALEAHLARFPSDPHRAARTSLLRRVIGDQARDAAAKGRADEALRHYAALEAADPSDAVAAQVAVEAALVERSAKRLDAAEKRLRAAIARLGDSPQRARPIRTLARLIAFDRGDMKAAKAFLEKVGGSDEAGRLDGTHLAIRTTPQRPGRDARVEVHARNIEAIDARLHAVDLDAYLRTGGAPSALPDLDVAVIAPDRRWSTKVPRYAKGKDVTFDLAIPKPKPGLYVVTVKARTEEASALLWVSRTRIAAQMHGPDLAVAVFDDDAPAGGATVKVRAADGTVTTGTTDRTGLYRTSLKAIGPVSVLAEHRGAPALLAVQQASDALPEPSLRLAVETDRPLYRPGDRVGIRVIARKGDAPVTGRFKLWLQTGRRLGEIEVEASRFGTVVGELRVPSVGFRREGESRSAAVWVQPPGADPRQITRIQIRPDSPAERSLDLFHEGSDAVALVREADGRPAAGVMVELSATGYAEPVEVRTDAQGRARLAGPPAALSWDVRAAVKGTTIRRHRARERQTPAPIRLAVDDGPAGASPQVWIHAPDGAYRLTWSPLVHRDKAPEMPADPWVPAWAEGLEGADGALDRGKSLDVWEGVPTSKELTVKGGQATLTLPALATGRWRVRLDRIGAPGTQGRRIEIGRARPGLSGVHDARAGAELTVGLSGPRPALVVAGGDRIRAAAVMRAGEQARWTTDSRWAETRVTAIDSAGHERSRRVSIDPELEVILSAKAQAAPTWQIDARVLDGAGRPVAAEVRLRIVDERLVESGFGPSTATLSLLVPVPRHIVGAGVFDVVHVSAAKPISAALLAEARRTQERQRAQAAASGRFDSRLGDVMQNAPLEAQGFGGLGTVGMGRGGGGMGAGRLGRKAKVRMGHARNPYPRGERERVLWHVQATDADGRVSITVPRPQAASRWTLEASAIAINARGQAKTTLSTHGDTRMHVLDPTAAGPDDSVFARVAVRHGGAAAAKGRLVIGEKSHPLALTPGGGAVIEAGPFKAGARVPITLSVGGATVEQHTWQVPTRLGAPAADGRVVTVAAGPGGTPPTTWLALRGSGSWTSAERAANAGRAALAALPGAKGADRAALDARITAAWDALGQLSPNTPAAKAAVLHFMAETRTRFDIPRGALESVGKSIGNPGPDPAVRVAVLHARVAAGLKVDDSVVRRLARATLPDEVASELARALVGLKRSAEAAPLVRGTGPHAVLARRLLKQRADAAAILETPPPAPGAAALCDWIRAVVQAPKSGRGLAEVRLGGAVVGTIDRATGGAVSVVGAGTPSVADLPALVWRSSPAPSGTEAVRYLRATRTAAGIASRRSSGVWPKPGVKLPTTVTLGLGDILLLAERPGPDWQPPPGLRWAGPARLRAVLPGTMVVAGLKTSRDALRAPLTVRVQAESPTTGLDQGQAMGRAEHAVTIGDDPTPWLAPWPADDAWTDAALAARRAQVRFDHLMTQKSPDAGVLIDRFEALREARPGASLPFEQVRRVAEAYRAKGVPERAVAIWRAGLGGAFLAEAGLPRRVENIGGLVASLEGLRRLATRYPGVPPVAKTTFLLPQRLDELAGRDSLPDVLTKAGINRSDLRLQAAGWDREFLALWPAAKERPQAAFHLVQTLQSLDAHAEAARWGRLLGDQHTDSAEYDGLLYLEGLSRLRLREDGRALKLFERLSTGEFPQEDGSKGPAGTRDDARFALARLYEARGDIKKAKATYKAAADTHEDAADSAAALEQIRLVADKFLRVKGGDGIKLPVTVANIDTVNLRAYRLDLRTVFLRDSGLDRVHAVQVSGVSPAWSGTTDVPRDPFPKRRTLKLPLSEPGAYLVQIEGGGQQATSLVVRSNLSLDARDGRVRVRLRGKPAAGIGVRTAGSGPIGVATTDVRGVALLDGDAVLAFTDDGHVAFTEPSGWTATPKPPRRRPSPRKRRKKKSNVKQRLQRQLEGNRRSYEDLLNFDAEESIQMDLL